MIAMKFGGSSVANAERIRHVAGIVQGQLPRKPVLLLSAMGGTTDHLLEAADCALKKGEMMLEKIENLHRTSIRELGLGESVQGEIEALFDELHKLLIGIAMTRELTDRTRDYLVSFGERLSVRITAAYLNSIHIKALPLDAWDAGFITNSNFGSAELEDASWQTVPAALLPHVEAGILPVVTGFIAKDTEGHITTLGRGGSDLSVTFIAASCKAEEAQIWKDVDGILTADPRLVKEARPVDVISYEQASELAYFGAQVLHPRAMLPLSKTGTPAVIKNSYNLAASGTRIVSALIKENIGLVQAITSRKNTTLIDIVSTRMLGQYGFLEGVFYCFARHCISVDMVATSEVSVSLTLDTTEDIDPLKKELSRIADVDVKTGKAIVTLIGDVSRSSEVLSQSFSVCAELGVQVQMVSQGASKVNISFIVNDTQAADVVKALHRHFFA